MARSIYSDGTYLKNNDDWHASDSIWKASQIERLLDRNALDFDTICDVGCGAGEVLRVLKRRLGKKVDAVGYEISPQAFELCKNKSVTGLTYRFEDLLADQSARFDVLMAVDVFEHVEDYIGFIRALRNHGEYLIFHIPLDLSSQAIARGGYLESLRRSVGHLHYFTKDSAIATLEHAGCEVLDYFYTDHAFDLHNRGWKTRIATIPRKIIFSINEDFCVRLLGGWSLMVLAK